MAVMPPVIPSELVATQAGNPPTTCSIWPVVPIVRLAKVFAFDAYSKSPVAYDCKPVPPRVAARIPVVSLKAIPRVEVATAETVLSALILRNDKALGLVSVKMLEPTVVAPKLVRAPAAVVAPVPPEVRARAFTRFKVVMVDEAIVVVAKVEVPVKIPPEIVLFDNVCVKDVPTKVAVPEGNVQSDLDPVEILDN